MSDNRYKINAYKSRKISVDKLDRIFDVGLKLIEGTSKGVGFLAYFRAALLFLFMGAVGTYLKIRKDLIEEDLEMQKQGVEMDPPFGKRDEPPEEGRSE